MYGVIDDEDWRMKNTVHCVEMKILVGQDDIKCSRSLQGDRFFSLGGEAKHNKILKKKNLLW